VQDKFAIPQAKIMETSVEDYKAAQINIWEAAKGAIGQSDLSPSTKECALAEAATRVVSNISQVSGNYVSAFFRANPEAARDEYVAYGQKILKSLPSDYYVVTEEMAQILNSPVAIMTNAYPTIVGSVNDVDFGMEDGLLKQMAKVRSIFSALSEFQPLTEAQKEEMKTLPEACQQYLNAKNEALLVTLEANKKKTGFRINEAGEVADEDLFASIISKFDGKVRLVDFWATWCGPCRMANKEMIPMKEDLKDKDIVYIYITGETSPKGTWENMIPDIHGEHFRVTDKQWSYLCDKYGVEGVPTYIVVDTEGEIKYKSVGFPGVSKMKEELLKAAVK
jgi:thiol-disulfide isomerase/thioredoxin